MTVTYTQWRRSRECRDKIRYSSAAVAANAATALGWAGRAGLRPYRCRYCRQWHVGHPAAHDPNAHQET